MVKRARTPSILSRAVRVLLELPVEIIREILRIVDGNRLAWDGINDYGTIQYGEGWTGTRRMIERNRIGNRLGELWYLGE